MARWARWVLGPILAAPLGAWALGLGEIELKSALNQPLNAEIALISASGEELGNLRVELASRETFERYGIQRPAFLSDLRFTVTRNTSGRQIIQVASLQSITEPFVTILVEAVWARGRLLREYTVLLDPPILMPGRAAETPLAAPTTGSTGRDQAGRIARPTPAPAAPAPTAPVRPAAVSAPRQVAVPSSDGTYGPVQRNETLWAIAETYKPSELVSMNQMMLAIFEANPQAFNGNINRLRRGAILRLPAFDDVRNLGVAAANQAVAQHNADWRGGTAAASAEQEARLRLVSPEDTSAGVGPGTAAGTSTADQARLRALEDQVVGLEDDLAESERLLAIRDAQLQELQERLAETSAQPDVQPAPGVDLGPDELLGDEGLVDTLPLDGEPADTSAEDTTTVEPVPAPPPAPTRVVSSAPPEPSLLDTILGWLTTPLLWIVLGVLALIGAAVWYLRQRQESIEDITGRWEALEAEPDEDAGAREATARLRAQVPEEEASFVVVEQPTAAEHTEPNLKTVTVPLGETADETLSSQTAINLDQADPVAEADFHMAYGLYDQAADLLNKALLLDPDRRDLKLKLLEVFFVWGNREQFLDAAQTLKADMGDEANPDWDKIVIMGMQICPDAELFSQAPAPAAGAVGVDLDLEAGEGTELDLSLDDFAVEDTGIRRGLDLDLGDDSSTNWTQPGEPAAATDDDSPFGGPDPDMDDLDIGAQTAAGLEAALFDGLVDENAQTSETERPDLDPLSETAESPTLEGEAPTAEMPTIETPLAFESEPTVETPVAFESEPTVETPAADMTSLEISAPGATEELQTLEQPATAFPQSSMVDNTAEINLDDLGLDIEGLGDEAPHELALDDSAVGEQASAPDAEVGDEDAASDLLSATGVTQVLGADQVEYTGTEVLTDEEATMLAPSMDDVAHTGTQVLPGGIADPNATVEMLPQEGAEEGVDLDLGDLSSALSADTVEQPVARDASFSDDVFGGGADSTAVDLDVGHTFNGNAEPSSTEEVVALDPQTMTEVGTKLDLARAYIDMGDPEGARSILEEVLQEGDAGQRQEAQGLMESLGA